MHREIKKPIRRYNIITIRFSSQITFINKQTKIMPIMKWSDENKKFENYYKVVELVVNDFKDCYVISRYKGKSTEIEKYDDLFMAQRRFAQIVCGLIL